MSGNHIITYFSTKEFLFRKICSLSYGSNVFFLYNQLKEQSTKRYNYCANHGGNRRSNVFIIM